MTGQDQPSDLRVSHMSYTDLVGLFQLQIGRVEMVWFRVMYLHAAMVGVLIFFGEATQAYVLQRALVFAFYTVNLLIFHAGLREGYHALRCVTEDMRRFPETDGRVDQWFRSHRFGANSGIRIGVMAVMWLLVGFLLFQGWLSGG